VEPTEHNRRAWDAAHTRAGARSRRLGIPEAVRVRLPALAGKHVLHLQCGAGDATAELAEAGALVTGVGGSTEELEAAQERAPTAAFVRADVLELPLHLTRARFDVVFTGDGVFDDLVDLAAWARVVVSTLRGGGTLVAYDGHPVGACVDKASHWRADYFDDSAPPRLRRLAEIVTAVADAGLVVRSLDELSSIYETLHREKDPRVPGHFVLVAEKPG
jgi:SAM-dependent methyltransferase